MDLWVHALAGDGFGLGVLFTDHLPRRAAAGANTSLLAEIEAEFRVCV
jgi:hypothetical protein